MIAAPLLPVWIAMTAALLMAAESASANQAEPQSLDSFLQWGFFLEIFTRTEYAEAYLMEPLAQQMMKEDPVLKAAFEARLAEDPEFAASPYKRLMWFYEKTPWFDQRYLLYPVARIP